MTQPKIKMFAQILFLTALFLGIDSHEKKDVECIDGEFNTYFVSGDTSGNIYSPSFKERKPYPTPMSCSVTLQVHEGEHIRLTFNFIDIALNNGCSEDKLAIIDGENYAGLFCGNITVYDIISTENQVKIQFETTPFGSGLGFNITYRKVLNTNLCKSGEFQCRNRRCIPDSSIRCNGNDDCEDGTDEEDCNYPIVVPEKCGIPDVQPDTGNAILDRIVGGREAVRGSWPWQVDMQFKAAQPNGHFCGGTLINSQWFITAAHCIGPVRSIDKVPVRVHLGNHHRYKKDPYEKIRYLKEYFVYGVNKDQFVNDGLFSMDHDLALVKLNAPVEMNPHIQVACLPDPGEELKVGQKCFATGWGDTRGSSFHDVLKQVESPIQTSSWCYNIHVQFVSETMICSGRLEPLNGLCHGDSGGPLVCKKDNKWHVYGAVSFLSDINYIHGLCGVENKLAAFAKISHKINWIKSTIAQNS